MACKGAKAWQGTGGAGNTLAYAGMHAQKGEHGVGTVCGSLCVEHRAASPDWSEPHSITSVPQNGIAQTLMINHLEADLTGRDAARAIPTDGGGVD